MAADDVERQRPRLGDTLLELRQLRLPDEFQLDLRQRRLAQNLPQAASTRPGTIPAASRSKRSLPRGALRVQRRPQLVELVLDLLLRRLLVPRIIKWGRTLGRAVSLPFKF